MTERQRRPFAAYAVAALLAIVFAAGLVQMKRRFIDYVVYETAGQKIAAGKITALYDRPGEKPDGFYYSYVFALAFVPFAWLGETGRFAFLLLYFAAYVKILRFSCESAWSLHPRPPPRGSAPRYALAAWLVLLTLYAINNGLMNANIGPLLLALGLIAFEQRERRPEIAGVVLGFAIAVKSYPVILLGYFLWEKRLRVCVVAVLSAVFFLVGLPILLYGTEQGLTTLGEYSRMLSRFEALWRERGWHFGVPAFQNLTGTAIRYGSRFGIAEKSALLWSALAGTAALTSFFLPTFFRRRESLPEGFPLRMFYLALAAVPMLVPISWHNMHLFYAPLVAHLVVLARHERERGATLALLAFVLLTCLTPPDVVGRAANGWLTWWSFPWFGLAALVIAGVVDTVRRFPRCFSFSGSALTP